MFIECVHFLTKGYSRKPAFTSKVSMILRKKLKVPFL